MEHDHERTAELLLELHASHQVPQDQSPRNEASQYQSPYLQSSQHQGSQPRHIRTGHFANGGDPDLSRGTRVLPSIEYTIEGKHAPTPSQRRGNALPGHTIKEEPRPIPMHPDNLAAIAQTGKSKVEHTVKHHPHLTTLHPDDQAALDHIGKSKEFLKACEDQINIMKWAENTLYTGRKPPHPVILSLMERFMTKERAKRAGSEPPTPPSAVRRITSLPTYGAGKEVQHASGSRTMSASKGESSSGRSISQRDVKNSKRGASSKVHSSPRLDVKDVIVGSSPRVSSSSRNHKPAVTSANSHSQPIVKRQIHHCIRDGHLFDLLPLNKPGTEGGRVRTENKIASRKFKCGKCESRIDETRIRMCKVPVCGVMVCGDCEREWEATNKGWLRMG
ncbi:hypothetical protein MMC30_002895 [Trapelia coarctata]|nr:hypothetical protein [Trapelia coarctata]